MGHTRAPAARLLSLYSPLADKTGVYLPLIFTHGKQPKKGTFIPMEINKQVQPETKKKPYATSPAMGKNPWYPLPDITSRKPRLSIIALRGILIGLIACLQRPFCCAAAARHSFGIPSCRLLHCCVSLYFTLQTVLGYQNEKKSVRGGPKKTPIPTR